jgi:hypothetical protein
MKRKRLLASQVLAESPASGTLSVMSTQSPLRVTLSGNNHKERLKTSKS